VRSRRRVGKVESEDGDSRFLGTLEALHQTTERYISKKAIHTVNDRITPNVTQISQSTEYIVIRSA
jgi:hypothetical protein